MLHIEGFMCHFSQCPAGGSRVRYKEEGKASAQLPEILPRLQAAQGLGVPHPRVTAPAGRQLPGTSCGKNAPSQTHPEVQRVCASVCAVCQVLQNNSENILFFSLQQMLSKVGTWNFDIFLFDRLTNGETHLQPSSWIAAFLLLQLLKSWCLICYSYSKPWFSFGWHRQRPGDPHVPSLQCLRSSTTLPAGHRQTAQVSR